MAKPQERNPAGAAIPQDKVLPQNVDAEEGLLCSILIDNSVLLDVLEILTAEDFYRPKHQKIFAAVAELFERNEPVDLITLSNLLEEKKQLEEVGGAAFLASLLDEVPAAVNAAHYARIIHDKASLRMLIIKSNAIARRCFEDAGDVDSVIDFAENAVFEISKHKTSKSFYPISQIIERNIDALEERQGNKALVTGVPTGFSQLDSLTAGFQPSDLLILAARPSMGKCCAASTEILLEDGGISTIEEICRRKEASVYTLGESWRFSPVNPSDFIDDGKKPVFRVTTSLGRCVETTLSHPFLTIQGWKPLSELAPGDAVAVPRQLNVFGIESLRDCEIKLLAYLIGDGNLTGTCPRFSNVNRRVLDEFSGCVAAFGGCKTVLSTPVDRSPSIRVSAADAGENRVAYGKMLAEQIGLMGMSQCRFAAFLGVSAASVSNWVNGKCAPSPDIFDLIAQDGDLPHKADPWEYAAIAKNSRNPLTLWLASLGIYGKDAHEKFVPAPVFKLVRPQIAMFLNRLFATDGWICNLNSGQVQLGYASVSDQLIRQVQHLLLRFGIIGKVKHRSVRYKDERRSAWQIDITDAQSIKRFGSEIGIFGKEGQLEKALEVLHAKKYQTNVDLIPRDIWKRLAEAKGDASWAELGRRAGLKGYTNLHVGKRSVSRSRLRALAAACGDEELVRLAESDVYWDRIVSIESVGAKQVYDLTIPRTHNFVANDICVHNTAFALNIARNAALEANIPVAVFSLEMSKEQLSMRLLCSEARIDSSRLRSGFFSREDWARLTDAADVLSQSPIFIDDSPDISAMEIRAKARRLKMEKDLGMVIIDYLQLMKGRRDIERRDLEISEISRSLKALAKEIEVPVMALSQLNRKLEERSDKRPQLADLRESGALEQDADVVAFIYRDEVYNKDENNPNRGKAEIILAKQRNGPVGMVPLTFISAYTRFENPAPDYTV